MSKKLNPVSKATKLYSVEEFLRSASQNIPDGKKRGFVSYMRSLDKYYSTNPKEYFKYLDKYLGK